MASASCRQLLNEHLFCGFKIQDLAGLARGRLCKEIADELDISVNTVNTYLRRIYEKL
ncbi:LuxR C-terminal-related transcriptional regulator [Pontiella sulfatireligans]|uniref:LuxR C-terminal-related transcriptional regulator n=1 Tax=Pontiella sulfatireligans TaxID=2750658 RepID=UPI00109C4D48